MKLKAFVLILSATLFGCGETIPNTQVNLSKAQSEKLARIGQVGIAKMPLNLVVQCYSSAPGIFSYLITSSSTNIDSKEAKWGCFHFTQCPFMEVVSVNRIAFAQNINANIDEYSKSHIETCARMMVEKAPTAFSVTPSYADSHKKQQNSESWKGA